MSTSVRELVTTWGFDIDEKPLKNLESKIKDLKKDFRETAIQIAAVSAALFEVANISADYGNEAAEAADRLNMNVEQYQAYQRAAQMAGVEQERFNQGMTLMTKQAYEVINGNEQAAQTFAMIGVNVRDANGNLKRGDILLRDVADGLMSVEDKGRRLAMATEIFGARNARMLTFLKEGRAGMRRFLEEGKQYGFIMGEDAIEASKRFHDSVEKTQFVLYGLRNMLGMELIPEIEKVITSLLKWVRENREIIRQNFKGFVQGVVIVFKALFAILKPLVSFVSLLVRNLGGAKGAVIAFASAWGAWKGYQLVSKLISIVKYLREIPMLMKALTFLFVDTPWGLLLLPLLLVLQDVFYFAMGKKSVFGVLVKSIEEIMASTEDWLDAVNYGIQEIVNGIPFLRKFIEYMKGEHVNEKFDPKKYGYGPRSIAMFDWLEEKRNVLRGAPTAHVLGGVNGGAASIVSNTTVNVIGGVTNEETGTVVGTKVEEHQNRTLRNAFRTHRRRIDH